MSSPLPLDNQPIPVVAWDLAGDDEPILVWRNGLDGLCFRLGHRFLKWNPRANGIDLRRERRRLERLAGRHPVPAVIDAGSTDDADWLLTAALPGVHAIGARWTERIDDAVTAIATGLRTLHSLPIEEVPSDWADESWGCRTPPKLGTRPPITDPVLVHGDACAPNTLLSDDGDWVGHVDLGDAAVGDRWADLAVAAMSLGWNFDGDHEDALYAAYGIDPDPVRIDYYRRLWNAES